MQRSTSGRVDLKTHFKGNFKNQFVIIHQVFGIIPPKQKSGKRRRVGTEMQWRIWATCTPTASASPPPTAPPSTGSARGRAPATPVPPCSVDKSEISTPELEPLLLSQTIKAQYNFLPLRGVTLNASTKDEANWDLVLQEVHRADVFPYAQPVLDYCRSQLHRHLFHLKDSVYGAHLCLS